MDERGNAPEPVGAETESPKRVGGRRPGSGRKPGTPNKRTLQKQRLLADAEAQMRASLTPEQVASMTSLDVMRFAMRTHAAAGNLTVAASIARDLAPYEHARKPMADAPLSAEDRRAKGLAAMRDDPDPATMDRGTKADRRSAKEGRAPLN